MTFADDYTAEVIRRISNDIAAKKEAVLRHRLSEELGEDFALEDLKGRAFRVVSGGEESYYLAEPGKRLGKLLCSFREKGISVDSNADPRTVSFTLEVGTPTGRSVGPIARSVP